MLEVAETASDASSIEESERAGRVLESQWLSVIRVASVEEVDLDMVRDWGSPVLASEHRRHWSRPPLPTS